METRHGKSGAPLMRIPNRFVLMRSVWLAIILCLGLAIPVHAVILIAEDSFEGANPEASGWRYTASYCSSSPCPWLDVSTDVAHAGSKSLKGTYSAAWSPTGINNAAIYRTFTPTTDLYNRYYYRTSGFIPEPSTGTKHIYWRSSTSTGVPDFFSINFFGSRELSMAGQILADCGYSSCNFYPNMASKPLADNVWYCIEEHIKLNDIGVANGMVEIWIDGVQTVGYYNRTFRGTAVNGPNGNSSTTLFDEQRIYKQAGDGLIYYDQFTAATTRVGCSGSPPSADTTPPATPAGLFIR